MQDDRSKKNAVALSFVFAKVKCLAKIVCKFQEQQIGEAGKTELAHVSNNDFLQFRFIFFCNFLQGASKTEPASP